VRVRAKNYWGWGEWSDVLLIKASSVPEQVSTATTAIDEATGGLRVEWTEPFDNSDEITEYEIEAKTSSGDWLSICDGSDAQVVATLRCIVDMSVLTEPTTFGLVFEDMVEVRVAARNVNGLGEYSSPNTSGEYVRTAPTFMNALLRDPLTNDHQLHVYWNALDPVTDFTATGGSAILSYGLEWDDASDEAEWYPISGFSSDSTATSLVVQSGITEGSVYHFRLTARNIYGWGPASEVLEIAAAGIPEQMQAPETQIDPDDGLNILVSWVEPHDNSDPISAYSLVFRASDGNYYSVSECVSEEPSLTLSCSVPMAIFLEEPFNLQYNDLVQVRAQATNTNDYGDLSETNLDGARIQTKPE
jgi:hypothetical protein